MSLRLRLLAGLAALVVVGLALFGTTTYISVKRILIDRLDAELRGAAKALLVTDAGRSLSGGSGLGSGEGGGRPSGGHGPGPPPGSPAQDETTVLHAAGSDLFGEFVRSNRTVYGTVTATATTAPVGVEPTLPDSVYAAIAPPNGKALASAAGVAVRVFDAAPKGGVGGAQRVAVALPPNGGATVVAASLEPTRQTLQRLLEIEVAVGAGVLALTLGLGLALARQATRPLEEIAATADAIAAGDMDRRVPAGPATRGGSETGRVAVAFNAMLVQIQEAFSRRDATEARLRTFVADASHELSTPLTSIRGYAELFHRGLKERPEDLAKALERIESEATRMGLLVDELLTLASFDAGRPLARDPIDLRTIAADTVADLEILDPQRPVSLHATQPVIVVGDESRLRQVAANLVSNVRRHTPAGTAVTISAHREDGVGILRVADRGPGMTPEQAAKVFDRFYRVDKARSRAMGGAGLGLAIVATIAEAHGGRATVTTTEGRGTTFSVAIPLAEAPDPD